MVNDKAELIAEVVNRSSYPDLVNRMNIVIGLAERQIEKNLRVSDMVVSDILTFDGLGFADLPSDMLELIELRNGEYKVSVVGKEASKVLICENVYIEGNKVKVTPVVSALNITYYQKIPSLNNNQTNWLLEKEPEIYLSGVLLQAFIMSGDREQAGVAREYFNDMMIDFKAQDNSYRYSKQVLTLEGVV